VERIEGIVAAMEILHKRDDHLLVNALYHRFKNYKRVPGEDKLFVFQHVYKDKIEYFNSISACYVNDKESGYICCKKILINNVLSEGELVQTLKNLFFYKEHLDNDNNEDIIKLFANVDKLYFKHKVQDENVSKLWKTLYNKRTTLLKDKRTNTDDIKSTNFIKIVNLLRREDRKEAVTKQLSDAKVEKEKYQFMEAVDGKRLEPNFGIKHLFRNNDFGYQRGVIGCALSHIQLWQQLTTDPLNDYYIILEDDITLCKKFNEYIAGMHHEFLVKDVIYLGYHMRENIRDKLGFVYNDQDVSVEDIKVESNVKKIIIGGTFAYSINKLGAKKLLDETYKNGIHQAIDAYMNNLKELEIYESRPQFVFSEWEEDNKYVDSDIQKDKKNCLIFPEFGKESDYVFLQGIDQIGNDILHSNNTETKYLIEYSSSMANCVAFNTFGYLKSKIEKLGKVSWFSEKDGIYIKKSFYEKYLEKEQEQGQGKESEKEKDVITITI
jgi:GR25 family glycosyltransferase involved in LPS biosynthesis